MTQIRQFSPFWNPQRCVLAALLVALVTGPAVAAAEVFTPRHVAQLKYVTATVVSPDGAYVAYTRSVQRNPLEDDDGPAWSELHVVDSRGRTRPFVTGKVNVSGVQWIPDGSGIAFLAKRGEDQHTALYVVPIDGGEARHVLDHDAGIGGVSFSRDGKQVAFLATEPLPEKQQAYRDQGFNQEIYEEDWRPTKVWIASVDGSDKPRSLELPGSASLVQWNPAAAQILVVLAPTALVDDSYMFKRVSIVDVDSGKIVERIKNPGKLGQVTWSPDGAHIAMVSGADIHDPQEGKLMAVAVPGDGMMIDLMPAYEAHVASFAWKDEQTLLWQAGEGVATRVGTVTVDRQRETILEPGTTVLSDLSLSGDGRVAVFAGQTPDHPSEVFRMDVDRGRLKRLTVSNPWLEDMRIARQEKVTWQARDGLRLEGVLVYPLNYVEGRRYPLIMYVHGGPEAHVSNGWITSYGRPGQVAAGRGFAVFYPNYRGSTGRGVEFSKLGQADAAGKEFDDFVDGVDHLIAIGLVDKDKVGITGGSYGGYASAWGSTFYSHRFAASVMFVGISDNISKVGTTDIPEEMYLVHHRKRLWDDWEYFLDRSPIRHVQKNRTPTLILHGKSDPRVHPSQSLELFRHLKTLDQAPVRLVLYPGEGHGNRRATARFDYNVRLLRWMEYYLQGPGEDVPPYTIDYADEFGTP